MELLGFFMFISDRKALASFRNYIGIFFSALALIIVATLSILINDGGQWMYHMVFISTIMNFFGAFFIYKISRNTIKNIDEFFKVILFCVFLQCLITVSFKILPGFYDLTYSVVWSEAITSNMEYGIADFYRLVGLGNAVAFSVLPTAGLGMLTCSYFITKSKGLNFYLYCIGLFIIISVSFLVARTSLLLAAISIFYILITLHKNHRRSYVLKFVTVFGIIISVIISVAIIILPQDMYLWAFEVFLNMQDGGTGAETGSGELLYSMVTETHFTPKTLIIGDAMYTNPNGGYYGSVDIGFYRQVLYYGLIGLSVFLLLHYRIIKRCMIKSPNTDVRRLFLFLFFCLIIILMKGDTVLAPLFIFLLVMIDFSFKNSNIYEKAKL